MAQPAEVTREAACVAPANLGGLVSLGQEVVEAGWFRETFREPSGEIVVAELITGQAAQDYLARKGRAFARIRSAFAIAARDMRQRGFEEAGQVTVERVYSRGSTVGVARGQQESAVTSKGEVVTNAWDDGNDATFEATWYAENYKSHRWRVYNAQIDVRQGSPKHKWDDYIDGGKGGAPGPLPVSREDSFGNGFLRESVSGDVVVAADAQGESEIVEIEAVSAAAMADTLDEDWKQFISCAWDYTIGAALTCAWAGWWWAACFFGLHSVLMVTCAIKAIVL